MEAMGKKTLSLTEIAEKAGYVGGYDDQLDVSSPIPPPHVIVAISRGNIENIWATAHRDLETGEPLFV
jgi:hypothetical protein